MAVHPGENIAIDTNRNVGSSGITNVSGKTLEEQEIRNLRLDEQTNALISKELSGSFILDELRKIQQLLLANLTENRIISLKLDCLQPENEDLDASDLDNLEQ